MPVVEQQRRVHKHSTEAPHGESNERERRGVMGPGPEATQETKHSTTNDGKEQRAKKARLVQPVLKPREGASIGSLLLHASSKSIEGSPREGRHLNG